MEKALYDIQNQKNEIKDMQNQRDFNPLDGTKKETAETKIDDKNMLRFLENKMKEMETEFDLEENLVIDLGSAFTKVGFSGEDLPRFVIPSIYSSLKNDPNKKSELIEKNQTLFGYEVYSDDREMYNIKFLQPGDHEQVIDEEFLYFLREIINNKLGITASDYNVIVNCSPIRNKKNINVLTNLFLEDFNFKGLSIVNSSSLSLFATGRTSGLVVDCGEKKTMCVPIYEGFPLYHALNILPIGGRDISSMFLKGIKEAYPEFNEEMILSIREIKEKMASVAYLKEAEYYIRSDKEDVISTDKILYKLPDNTGIIEIPKKSRITASELLFNPSLINSEEKGLLYSLSDSLKKTVIDNEEIKQIMFNNIVLAGGTSMMKGFSQRIYNYLPSFLETNEQLGVVADNLRYISTWIGASMISSMSTFNKLLITRENLTENGDDRIGVFKKIF